LGSWRATDTLTPHFNKNGHNTKIVMNIDYTIKNEYAYTVAGGDGSRGAAVFYQF
jgi:hypothetical protein